MSGIIFNNMNNKKQDILAQIIDIIDNTPRIVGNSLMKKISQKLDQYAVSVIKEAMPEYDTGCEVKHIIKCGCPLYEFKNNLSKLGINL